MKILVCGDRTWSFPEIIRKTLDLYKTLHEIEIIEGDCTGADRIAGQWAQQHQVPLHVYPADWSKGLAAGPIRNRQMLTEGQPDLVLAFHDHIVQSKGTKNMVTQAQKAKITCILVKSSGEFEVLEATV